MQYKMDQASLSKKIKKWFPLYLVHLSVGLIFFSEGVQKFLYPALVGEGRFSKIGLFLPHLTAPLVGATEMIAGVAILLTFKTRLMTLPLITIMIVAIVTTKIPILLEGGFWKFAHDSRTDFSMLLSLLFLFFTHSSIFCRRE